MDDPSEVPDLLPCLIRPKVLLAGVAVIGVIVAILRWQPGPKLTASLIALMILIGIAAIYGLAKDEFNLRRAKHLLALRLEEGQVLYDKVRMTGTTYVAEAALNSWNELTETNLRKYVDELHVARFRFAGFKDEAGRFNTYRLEAKMVFLDELLKQLKG